MKATRILVGLKNVEHIGQLAELACDLATPDATVFLVHVIEVPDATPLNAEVPEWDEEARRILDAGQRIVVDRGLKARLLQVRARSAGEALIDDMRQHQIELAVLGYHHKRTLREILLGTAAAHVMGSAPCPVVLSVPARNPG